MPLIGCAFADSRSEALLVECGAIELVRCPECTHVYNRAFEPERVKYAPGYENALGFSPHYNAYLSATAERLICTYELRRKSIVEIGCGSADLLSLLCGQGGNHGIGYDPSQQSRTFRIGEGSIEIRSQGFTALDCDPVDFVCSKHVLEHLDELQTTLRQARSILRQDGAGYFEVPDGITILHLRRIWDLSYEHVSYFSPLSLQRALSDAGFSVVRVENGFGGQYLQAEVLADRGMATTPPKCDTRANVPSDFAGAFGAMLEQWKDRMTTMVAEGRRVVLWGAGMKAVGFLNMLAIGATEGVEYVVDINPRKAGRFVPGTAQRIVSPEYLRDYRPDVVVVMNPEYLEEIRSMLESTGLHCDLLTASPGSAPLH
jgi:SAM-dependent methyltransferase